MAAPTPSYLDQIVARTRLDVAEAKRAVPEADLRAAIAAQPPPTSLAAALARGAPLAVLAEFKKASPSKGDIAPDLVAAEQALRYAAAGCNVVSVLTEPHWFKGSLADLAAVKAALVDGGHWPRVAVLRKDFIVDAYQLLEARAHGADTALLIVAVLSSAELAHLIAAARALGFEPLVEVNTADEMRAALAAGARAIGVNNRNLHTFVVDMQTTERLGAMIPPGAPVQLVSLSGVAQPADVAPALAGGAVGVLVGEALMRAADPAELIVGLRGAGAAARGAVAPPPPRPPLVKVCGLRTASAAVCALEAGADLLGLIFVKGSKRTVSADEGAEIVAQVRARAIALGRREGAPVRAPPASAAAAGAVAWFGAGRDALDAAVGDHGRALVVGVFQDQVRTARPRLRALVPAARAAQASTARLKRPPTFPLLCLRALLRSLAPSLRPPPSACARSLWPR
jgi:anthranilate synthase/indole-3-glycerol phosphate synthase/phosphoribosylanthranilate isomerase